MYPLYPNDNIFYIYPYILQLTSPKNTHCPSGGVLMVIRTPRTSYSCYTFKIAPNLLFWNQKRKKKNDVIDPARQKVLTYSAEEIVRHLYSPKSRFFNFFNASSPAHNVSIKCYTLSLLAKPPKGCQFPALVTYKMAIISCQVTSPPLFVTWMKRWSFPPKTDYCLFSLNETSVIKSEVRGLFLGPIQALSLSLSCNHLLTTPLAND